MKLLETFPPRLWLWAILPISFIAMLIIWLQFLPLEDIMKQGAGYGIVDLELAFTAAKAADILGSWDVNARAAAQRSLLIDYAFMPAYGLFFASVSLLLARAQIGVMRQIGLALTIGSLIAALLDTLENALLIIVLNSISTPTTPSLIAGVAA